MLIIQTSSCPLLISSEFLISVIIASSSGALTPGPLFLASTLRAARSSWRAGVECAIGHTIVELPLVLGLSLGLSSFLLGSVKIIGLLGGCTLVAFATIQILQARKEISLDQPTSPRWDQRSGVVVGLVFTAINPFFLVWWATVGSLLVAQALIQGALFGVFAMFAAHIWMDYAWLGGTATLAARGKFFLGRWYRAMLITFAIGMLYFGATFIASGILP